MTDTPQVREALRLLVATIYFDDSSDFSTAIWEAIRNLDPAMAELLESNPKAAFDSFALGAVAPQPGERRTDDPASYAEEMCRVFRESRKGRNPEEWAMEDAIRALDLLRSAVPPTGERLTDGFAELVAAEITKARSKHRNINSPHEGYAVVLEEMDEMWDEVRAQHMDRDKVLKELVQVAAMCQRMAEDCDLVMRAALSGVPPTGERPTEEGT